MTQIEKIRKRKSVQVEPKLLAKLSKWYSKHEVKAEAEESICIDFRIIEKTIARGTCSPDTKTRIQNFFN